MTENSIIAIATSAASIVGSVCAVIASTRAARNSSIAATNSARAADKASQSATNSSTAATQVAEVHKLVNGQFSEQLKKVVESADKLAAAVPSLQNIAAAKDAQVISDDHAKGNPS